MQPYIEIFNLQISSYMLCALLGFAAITFFYVFRMDKYGIGVGQLLIYYVVITVCLLVFSRVFYVIGRIPTDGFSYSALTKNLFHGGIVFYGGLIGAILGTALCSLLLQRDVRASLDFFAPGIPLFHSIARCGCMLSGCCYGKVCTHGIPNQAFPGVKLFPVQAVESVCNLIIFAALILYTKKRASNRYCLEIYLGSYAVCRFVLEFFRGDTSRGIWSDGLSTSQNISILIILVIVIQTFIRHRRSHLS